LEELLIRADRAAVVESLARGMAHDLRGPLQTLILMVDPHAEVLTGPEASRLRGAMGNALQQLTDNIGRFSQIYAPVEDKPAPVIVGDLLGQVVDLQRYLRSPPAIEVELQLPGGLPPVRAVETYLRHILLNLILNARQALVDQPRTRIRLGAAMGENGVQLTVDDNGPGLSPAARSRAFELFYSTHEGSLGIGLTVARWLAERQGGKLTLDESAALGGVRAAVSLAAWQR
jgi:signal transduction histidine kinase